MNVKNQNAYMARCCRRNDLSYEIIDGQFYLMVEAGPCMIHEAIDTLDELKQYL